MSIVHSALRKRLPSMRGLSGLRPQTRKSGVKLGNRFSRYQI